jgi:hypothetical protein
VFAEICRGYCALADCCCSARSDRRRWRSCACAWRSCRCDPRMSANSSICRNCRWRIGSAGLAEPVLDTDQLVRHYPDALALMQELKGLGARNAASDRRRGLFGRAALRTLTGAYETSAHAGRYSRHLRGDLRRGLRRQSRRSSRGRENARSAECRAARAPGCLVSARGDFRRGNRHRCRQDPHHGRPPAGLSRAGRAGRRHEAGSRGCNPARWPPDQCRCRHVGAEFATRYPLSMAEPHIAWRWAESPHLAAAEAGHPDRSGRHLPRLRPARDRARVGAGRGRWRLAESDRTHGDDGSCRPWRWICRSCWSWACALAV